MVNGEQKQTHILCPGCGQEIESVDDVKYETCFEVTKSITEKVFICKNCYNSGNKKNGVIGWINKRDLTTLDKNDEYFIKLEQATRVQKLLLELSMNKSPYNTGFFGYGVQGNEVCKTCTNFCKKQNHDIDCTNNHCLVHDKLPIGVIFDTNGIGSTQKFQKAALVKNIETGEESYFISQDDTENNEPVKIGYNFNGWYTDKECTDGKEFDFTSPLTETLTLYAKWSINKYTITYNLEADCTNNEKNIASFTVETNTITLYDPKREGYIFDGWYTAMPFEEKVTEIPKGTAHNIILYAHWKIA